MKKLRLLISLAVLGLSVSAPASVIIDVTQVGSDVVFSTNGSLNLTDASFVSSSLWNAGFISGGDNWYVASGSGSLNLGSGSLVDLYALTAFDGAFGTSTVFQDGPSSVFGDDFLIWGFGGMDPRQVGVESGYVSGSSISSGMIYSGATIAGLFMTPGTYEYSIPNDTITLNIGASSVPDSGSTVVLLGFALAGLAAAARHR